ncbi:MAG: hypothetical protein H6713_11130 [Myxococcales bacterium]|nr:hypothetical protein [Myxococcales bacterium]MCB9750527.1 hypothetical protein [Myxococcales bacterium]
MHRGVSSSLLALSLGLGSPALGACVPRSSSSGTRPPRQPAPASARASVRAPKILSAQLARPGPLRGGPETGYTVEYRVYVVFDLELAPASLWPDRFIVMLENGARAEPARASLAPANERDEQRTVALDIIARVTPPDEPPAAAPDPNGAPPDADASSEATPPQGGDPSSSPAWAAALAETVPRAITLAGVLHGASGEIIEELSSSITPADQPVGLAAAVQLPADATRCQGAAQVIRTYWTTPVTTTRPQRAELLAAFSLTTQTGQRLHPARLDDVVEPAPPQPETDAPESLVRAYLHGRGAPPDNVIDLCLAEATPAIQLEVAAGVLAGDGVAANPPISSAILLRPAPAPARPVAANSP